jgi:hypothetical protein
MDAMVILISITTRFLLEMERTVISRVNSVTQIVKTANRPIRVQGVTNRTHCMVNNLAHVVIDAIRQLNGCQLN